MDDLIADFLTETNESLADLDVALLKLEQTPDDGPTLSLIFRLVHTIKGTCGFLGLPRLEHVAHAAENVLGRVRDGELVVTETTISAVLGALDRIKFIIGGLAATGAEPEGDDSGIVAALDAAMLGAPPEPAAPPPPPPPPMSMLGKPEPEPKPEPAPPPHIAATPAPVHAAAPKPAAPHQAAPLQAVPAAPAAADADAHAPAEAAQTIRVAVDVLEDLMTLVSELVLTRNQLLQMARTRDANADNALTFAVPLQRLSHITSDLQEGVMKTRMQPIGSAWNKLPRLVRDLSHELGKKIELVMLGAETELDRQVLELIKDPLTHMVRNSGDHGLETTEERRAAGKPDTGRITLNAYHQGGHILIEIADDGRGLPIDRIRAKAIANNLATEAEVAAMPDEQVLRFIFRAGFSTAAAITAVSGRGVGMDVVRTNIEKIGGTINLVSRLGFGTTFTIKIPLTLAIVAALIVEAAGERFAIPQISVIELVRARAGGSQSNSADATDCVIEKIDRTLVLRLRERLLPLVALDRLLELKLDADGALPETATVVVAQVGGDTLGIIVDRVFDTEEIVVKPVAPILRHVTMFSGNTILGDGSVIMILDPNGVARAMGVSGGSSRAVAQGARKDVAQSGDVTKLLLFRAGDSARVAVPLGLIARLEEFPREQIERSAGQPVVQYRGRLMPLIALNDRPVPEDRKTQSVLVFADGVNAMGLMVDEIVDVVADHVRVEIGNGATGMLGTAIVNGHATDILDTGYWLARGSSEWFSTPTQDQVAAVAVKILIAEDSAFFRQLIVPALSAAGFAVTATNDAEAALRLRDAGEMFDLIVSDVEMPGMGGLEFARAVRKSGPWQELPMIALSSRAEPHQVAAGRDAGFTDYCAKFQRDTLLASIRQCLRQPVLA